MFLFFFNFFSEDNPPVVRECIIQEGGNEVCHDTPVDQIDQNDDSNDDSDEYDQDDSQYDDSESDDAHSQSLK